MVRDANDLSAFFAPRGVAIIGASREETKLGFGIVKNLRDCGYPGGIYPVNPKASDVLGLRCYPSIADVPDPVDLAVVIVPVAVTPQVIEDCGKRGLRAAIVVSGGFRETGPEGARLEERVLQAASQHNLRLMGPNCIGVIDTVTPLDTSFVAMPEPGVIGFFSQSGAICGGLINWTRGRRIGFSRFVSLGNQSDVNETDILEFLGRDPHTRVIAAYLETVSDGRRFMAAARRICRHKPMVVLKVGATQDGSRAASSHTGAMAGSEHAYEAAFRQTGVLRAESVEDLLDWTHALSTQPLPAGDGMAVLTNAGGPGVVAVDALQRAGLRLAILQPDTLAALRSRFPPECTLHNPVDLLAAADGRGYADALALLLRDANVSGVVVLHVPHVLVNAPAVLTAIGQTAKGSGKPVLVSLFGDYAGSPELAVLHDHGLPHFPSPERASRAMGILRRYKVWQDRADRPQGLIGDVDPEAALAVLSKARAAGRRNLPETEARSLLAAYGIPVPASLLARSASASADAARVVGFPVALKIASPDVLHKSDVGGVMLDLRSAAAVRAAFRAMLKRARGQHPAAEIWGAEVQKMAPPGHEVIIGGTRDPQFGHLLMFGMGGVFVETLGDVSFRVVPIDRNDAVEMIQETHGYRILQGARGQAPADTEALIACLLRVSRLLTDFPEIAELDINPLRVWARGQGVMALDARAVIDMG